MTTTEIGKQLVELCKQGQNTQAMETLYSPDIVSIEPIAMGDLPAEQKGMKAILAKGKWWAENNTVHSATVEGPFPHGDRFAVRFTYDVTFKPTSKRMTMDEVGLYTVKNDKIVREEFFYTT